jgi:hypothetical protein
MSARSSGRALPPEPGSLLARMLDRQMWCWGRDIRSPGGNLLVELGYRRRPGSGVRSTEYAACDGRHLLRLWGFGVMLVPVAGPALALQRNFPDPLLVAEDTARQTGFDRSKLDGVARRATADDRESLAELLPRLASRIADYEAQVVSLRGHAWRERVQSGWARGHGTVVDMPTRWRRMARSLESFLAPRARISGWHEPGKDGA